MCNRHVPHLIAEYEASKRDDVDVDVLDDEAEQPTENTQTAERESLLGSIVSRLTL